MTLCLVGERLHLSPRGECPNVVSQRQTVSSHRVPVSSCWRGSIVRVQKFLEVRKGFLTFQEKSDKKCCPVQGGLGFPISFMWHREVTRANLELKSKVLACLFFLWTGSCS